MNAICSETPGHAAWRCNSLTWKDDRSSMVRTDAVLMVHILVVLWFCIQRFHETEGGMKYP